MIEIYGKPACPHCETAKRLCEMRELPFKYFQLDTDFTREEVLEMFPGARTFPQIKVSGKSIGGKDQLVTYLEETGYNGTGYTL
jgi:glutaredoxin